MQFENWTDMNPSRAAGRLLWTALIWGGLLYLLIGLLIGENRTANLWINAFSLAAMLWFAWWAGVSRTISRRGWLLEGAALHIPAVQVANLLIVPFGGPGPLADVSAGSGRPG